MKKALKYILLTLFGGMMTVMLAAQNLPLAPQDQSIRSGVLPNGMSYYLVTNSTTKKIADFALVQRTGYEDLGNQAKALARDGLSSLLRFQQSPQAFLASHGVAPGKDGFVKVSEDATLFHFDNVIVTEQAIDSVLLVIMDIADRGTNRQEDVWDWYTPVDQAVIISGDIDADLFVSKLKMLSYMTPQRPSREREEHVWKDMLEPVFNLQVSTSEQIATVSATWTAPRIQKEYMKTVQPAIYSMFVNEIGILAKERILQRLCKDKVPVANVSYQHISSLKSFGDEGLTISISLSPDHIAKAVEVLASTMSSIDKGSATIYEFEMAKRRYLAGLGSKAMRLLKSNSEYVEYCASAFLYGAPLSTSSEIYPFLKYRSLPAETELKHFNNIAAAILDVEKNLTVTCTAANSSILTKKQLQQIFTSAWNSEKQPFVCEHSLDSLSVEPSVIPLKLKSAKKDPMSGGVVWTFENDFKVVYKRQKAAHRMYYSLALNGGYGSIRGLSPGEGAYVSDYLNLSEVDGLSARVFLSRLEEQDMTLNATVNLSNTIISGSVPELDLDLMMQGLLAFVSRRSYDHAAFTYYKSCIEAELKMMEGTVMDRTVTIDSLLCPGYEYSSHKTSGKLTEKFPAKVEEFWEQLAGKTNDGVLVLVGNIEETKLRKLLQNYIDQFKTTEKVYSRLNLNYQTVKGPVVETSQGDKNSVDVALTARLPLTAENYMASNIAASVLKQLISKEISGTGMYLRLAHDCRIYPQERFSVMISLEEADPQGFAHDIELTGAADALSILRNVLNNLQYIELSNADLVKHKNVLKGHLALKVTDPQYWTHALAMRYLDGKDFTTSYESKIDAITAEKVKSILASLSSTSRVEYIIEKSCTTEPSFKSTIASFQRKF
jgi:predicted Zn-dependent peptidase